MPHIVWDDSFSVHVKEIDEQHKKWIGIINDLHDSLIKGEGFEEITGKSLRAMEEYGIFHFSFEEQYMAEIGYSDLASHKHEHDEFLKKISQYVQDEAAGKLILNTEIMKMLKGWLVNHILQCDMLYADKV